MGSNVASHGSLYRYVEESCFREESFHFLQFEFLQRANIVHLQNKLATLKSRIQNTQGDDDGLMLELQPVLHAYASAVRDYSALHSYPALPRPERRRRSLRLERHFPDVANQPGRPFDSHYVRLEATSAHAVPSDALRRFLSRRLPLTLSYSATEKADRPYEYENGMPALATSEFVDRAARLLVAFSSGGFLLVPMIVMLLVPGRDTGVLTVSGAVLLFAVVLSFGVRATNIETMVATATYAAVLVVFVGANTSGPP